MVELSGPGVVEVCYLAIFIACGLTCTGASEGRFAKPYGTK